MIPQHVIDAYKEPHRKYHNTDHIESILSKIPVFVEEYRLSRRRDIPWLEICAWYHDVVYIPGDSDNEKKSADIMWADDVAWDHDLYMTIVKTKVHKNPESFLSAIFFDLDLADMGTDAYYENSLKIREEFGQFSDLEWLAGRQKFLADFLSRPFIYHTSLGYSLWEDNARRNMELELSFLQGKYGIET